MSMDDIADSHAHHLDNCLNQCVSNRLLFYLGWHSKFCNCQASRFVNSDLRLKQLLGIRKGAI